MRLHHLPAVVALLCCVACAQPRVHTRFTATLPDTRLAPLSDSVLPAYPMRDDHGVTLGGLGSDLFHSPGSPADDVWAVTDRGPNSVVKVRGKSRSTLVVPDFTPLLVHLQVNTMGVTLREVIPITDSTGRPVTSRPNNPDRDPQFWDATGHTKLAFDENGLDIEGMIRLRNGEFWVAEEYAPSLVHLDAAGHVLARYVPAGVSLPQATYPVIPFFPPYIAIAIRIAASKGSRFQPMNRRSTRCYRAHSCPHRPGIQSARARRASSRLTVYQPRQLAIMST